ncbi:MAG: hypothetical protein COT81_00990 [Candidatus Buchananbacteria bacterium CG10_big_fil_rev_8_21_14_0_10_42_9]|uniref:SCP domain-containing protein n=1 Tax=Candidatus Buchananbacteria bacterium CG10_big_fil_rev_8_21_14_0_10_42_9 TaxID=1974526 RepID=A0A2H0W2C9_9BACT|nr:MAG: hypothetical protein COT81_00990 [Candidatus Buchananbacteria bacterium CG10_big_fil_rev_8_21_14_0_10_42_9]
MSFFKRKKSKQSQRIFSRVLTLLSPRRRNVLRQLSKDISDFEQFKLDLKEIKKFVARKSKTKDEFSKAIEIKYLSDIFHGINLFFFPSQHNDHKPYAVRAKMLWHYLVIVVVIKVFVTGALFFTYPSPAELANIVTSKVVTLANVEREALGIQTLSTNPVLTKAALAKAKDMVDRDYFAHDTPEGAKPWTWINKDEYDYVYAGENLAIDFSSAELIHQAFMKSPTHRKNILNENFQDIGVAVVTGELGGRQTDLLVQFFGTSRIDALAKADANVTPRQPRPEVLPGTRLGESETGEVAGEELVAKPDTVKPTDDTPLNYSPQEASQGVIVVATSNSDARSLVQLIIEYSNIFFLAMVIFLFTASMINIFVKIKFQHPKVVLQSLAALALVLSIFLVKFHFIEEISPQLLIL